MVKSMACMTNLDAYVRLTETSRRKEWKDMDEGKGYPGQIKKDLSN